MNVKFVKQINGALGFQVSTASGHTRAFSAWKDESGSSWLPWSLLGFDKETDDWYTIESGFRTRDDAVEYARGLVQ